VSDFSDACVARRWSRAIEKKSAGTEKGPYVTYDLLVHDQLARAAFMLLGQNAVTFSKRPEIPVFAQRHRLPSMLINMPYVEAGGLMSYGPSNAAMYRWVAMYVDKILKGAKPADLPVEQPTKFELVINLRTAKALGLTIPPSLLARADEVIE